MFGLGKKKLKLITHDGPFHVDDVFSTALLSMILKKEGKVFEIIRTRDQNIIETGDYVYDVGGVYDEANNRFDHHQEEGAGAHANGIPYSSLGLVWKKFGEQVAGGKREFEIIEKKLIEPVDGPDNGVSLVEPKFDVFPYTLQRVFESLMKPTWEENVEQYDIYFNKCVELAKEILEREIKHAQAKVKAVSLVAACYEKAEDKRVIVFDGYYPLGDFFDSKPETLFVISQRRHDGLWSLMTLRINSPETFVNRKDLPKSWAGLRDEELQKVSGVSDATFCHRKLFLAVARSKEGAMKLAQIALES